MNNKPLYIFDLDGTVINSFHRVSDAYINGQFNLDLYLTKCNSQEQIKKDSLLPLASKGETFAVITARYLQAPDIAFLINNKLVNTSTVLMGRDSVTKEIRALSDAEYKVHQQNSLKAQFNASQRFIFFDDIKPVLDRLTLEKNITMINAVTLNEHLSYAQSVKANMTTKQVIESEISSAEFKAFCINEMIA